MNQPDSPEFTEILNRVPKWHMLTPGVDVWRSGDMWSDGIMWFSISDNLQWHLYCDKCVDEKFARRPIPELVRRNMAWWALYNQLATVAPIPRFDQAHSQFIVTLYADHSGDDNPSMVLDVEEESQFNGLRGFNGSAAAYSAIRALGGELNQVVRVVPHLPQRQC